MNSIEILLFKFPLKAPPNLVIWVRDYESKVTWGTYIGDRNLNDFNFILFAYLFIMSASTNLHKKLFMSNIFLGEGGKIGDYRYMTF